MQRYSFTRKQGSFSLYFVKTIKNKELCIARYYYFAYICAKQRIKAMNVDNVRSQMRKGMLEYCILLLLHGEASYASDIIMKLKEAHLIVVEGTLYPLLTRLKNDNLLSYEWVESTQGPPRKYYSLTPDGETFLQGLEDAWMELANTVNHLKQNQNLLV
jgi:PadR family transcriptional regulator PadR